MASKKVNEVRLKISSYRGNPRLTLRKEPVSMLDNGLNNGHHVHRGSCSHLSQTPGCAYIDVQKLDAF